MQLVSLPQHGTLHQMAMSMKRTSEVVLLSRSKVSKHVVRTSTTVSLMTVVEVLVAKGSAMMSKLKTNKSFF